MTSINQLALAGSATWKNSPTSTDWNTATNWSPATVPNGASDVATFATSNTTDVFVGTEIEVSEIVFDVGASPFTVTCPATQTLTISGAGIINNSAITQQLIAGESGFTGVSGTIMFTNSATAGTNTFFTLPGGIDEDGSIGGIVEFFDSSSADHATFEIFDAVGIEEATNAFVVFNPGSTAGNATFLVHGGHFFRDPGVLSFGGATAANAVITNDGGVVGFSGLGTGSGSAGNSTILNQRGTTAFGADADAGQATITNRGGSFPGDLGLGITVFEFTATAGTATIVNEGGNGAGAVGGKTLFNDTSTAGNAIVIANAGVDGGAGGEISFNTLGQGGTARFEIFGNATLDITGASATSNLTIGSLEGDGIVTLGVNSLAIGGTNRNTTFAGLIQGTGAVTKLGKGTLTLSGASSFTRGMTLNEGTLIVSNTFGSATGAGPVQANAGRLGGTGIIAGNLTLGKGNGTGAKLLTGLPKSPGMLTVQSRVTFNADSSLFFLFDSDQVANGTLTATGVKINPGALFIAKDTGNGPLPIGTAFTVINNISLRPITGSFSNLADGSTLTVGNNTFQASYEGGSRNDLTLTVVP